MKLQRQFKSKQLAKPKHRSLKELSHVMDRTSDDLMSRMRCEWNCARRAVLICQTRVTVCMLLCKRTLAIYVARLSSIMKLYLIANNSPIYYTDLQRFAGQPPPKVVGEQLVLTKGLWAKLWYRAWLDPALPQFGFRGMFWYV